MKKIIFCLLCFLALTTFAHAQSKTDIQEQSNIEKFSAKSGTLIEKRITNLGKVRVVNFQILTLTDLISNTKESGVRLETEYVKGYTSPKLAFLDKDEVDGLIKSINIIKTKVLNTTPENYTEVIFTSRSGFTSGCFFSEGKWTIFMKFGRFGSDNSVYFPANELDSIVEFFQQAKQKIEAS